MKAAFSPGDKEFFREVCEFAFGVNSKFSDIGAAPKESAFWADALIQTHQAVPGKARHKDRCDYCIQLLDLMEKSLHDNASIRDLAVHVDHHSRHEIKPFELRIMIESGLALVAMPATGGQSPFNYSKLAEGYGQHIKSATIPVSGSYAMSWGALGLLMHRTMMQGSITPGTCLLYSEMGCFSEGLRTAFKALSVVGGSDRSEGFAIEYASTIDKLDEAIFFFSIYSCLAIAEMTAEQENEKMFGPDKWHTSFLELPYYEFFTGHGGRMPLLRTSMMLASILFALSEGRKLGPAACALV